MPRLTRVVRKGCWTTAPPRDILNSKRPDCLSKKKTLISDNANLRRPLIRNTAHLRDWSSLQNSWATPSGSRRLGKAMTASSKAPRRRDRLERRSCCASSMSMILSKEILTSPVACWDARKLAPEVPPQSPVGGDEVSAVAALPPPAPSWFSPNRSAAGLQGCTGGSEPTMEARHFCCTSTRS